MTDSLVCQPRPATSTQLAAQAKSTGAARKAYRSAIACGAMEVPLNRRTPAANTAAKAATIARSDGAITFTGPLRDLRKVQKLLAGEPGVSAAVVGEKGSTRLRVLPKDKLAGWVTDR